MIWKIKNDKLYNYPFIQLLKDKGYQDRQFMYNPGDIPIKC